MNFEDERNIVQSQWSYGPFRPGHPDRDRERRYDLIPYDRRGVRSEQKEIEDSDVMEGENISRETDPLKEPGNKG